MILQSLVEFYEQLADKHPERIARLGWCSRQVAFMLELSVEGELINIIPAEEKRGWTRVVPDQVKRTVGVAANALCDNAAYLLGIDSKGRPARALQCFEASKQRHLALLQEIDSQAARAVCCFFNTWDPSVAIEHPAVVDASESLLTGGNVVFRVSGEEVLIDLAVCSAWDCFYRMPSKNATMMNCLVSGESAPIARLHPVIKGVVGAQSMGASFVGFNARAFESYGHDEEQGLNAPVSEYATFAYTTALNYLLSDRNHRIRLGDTTIVYWADKHDDECTTLATKFFNPYSVEEEKDGSDKDDSPDQMIDAVMKKLAQGGSIEGVDFNATFYVLGIAPNAARLSVRFFHRDTFGSMLENVRRHYERLDIARAPFERKYITPFFLLKETENPNAKQAAATSVLGGALMRSILSDLPYPEALFSNALLRVRASQDNSERRTHKVTRGRVAIVKAYLIKNRKRSQEEVSVSLNEERVDAPYVLGRLFSSLESIQEAASPNVNTTIKNKYFDSACTTPSLVFPIIIKLSDRHINKLSREKKGLAVNYEKLRGDLLAKIDAFPKRLSLEKQGDFILGYHHQMQKRFEKKDDSANQSQED